MFKMINKQNNQKGFTLVELIIVIAIIGILAGMAVPRLSQFNETAKEATDEANARTIASIVAILSAQGDVSETTSITEVTDTDILNMLPSNEVPTIESNFYNGGGASGTNDFYYENDDTDGIVIWADSTSGTAIQMYPPTAP